MFRVFRLKATTSQSLACLLISLGVAGLVAATALYVRQYNEPKLISSSAVKTIHVIVPPSSKKPSQQAVASYNVLPTLPKYITIPAIHLVQSRIIQLGLSKNNQIATPDNIYDAGWFNGSAEPGKAGAMFIYGHVSSWTANGVFYNLKKLQPGDSITITRGDNQTFTYQVVSSKIYPYNNVDMQAVLNPISNKPGLNLMTCTGQVIKGTSEFNERLVVFTSLVSAS